MQRKYTLRSFIATIFALALSACADGQLSNIYETLRDAITDQSKSHVTPELVQKVPYASMSGQIGSGPVSFLVLGTIQKDVYTWYSADRNAFVTKNGRLVKTAGLPKNMFRASYNPATDPIMQFDGTTPLLHNKRRTTTDLMPDGIYGLTLDCEYTYLGRGAIHILDKTYRTDALEESCRAEAIGWEFNNIFWIDADTREIRQSIQHIHPKIPPIKLQTLKPPAN